MDISTWYNDADYSDLTVELSDGREIKVHKSVLCTANEWFKKACGVDSSFAESNQDLIMHEDDDPNAMDVVLRHIYKAPIGPRHSQSNEKHWQFWLKVYITADKYLVPALSEQAYTEFYAYAKTAWDLDTVVQIIETLTIETSHDDKLVTLATELRQVHFRQLLRSQQYRETLEEDKALLWEHVDQLLQLVRGDGAGEVEITVSPGVTRGLYITNNGGTRDRVRISCASSLGDKGRLKLHEQAAPPS